MSELEARFEMWWGSEAAPKIRQAIAHEVKAMCRIAWMNGAYVERRNQEEETV